jgi:flagellar biosynthesis protein FlhA
MAPKTPSLAQAAKRDVSKHLVMPIVLVCVFVVMLIPMPTVLIDICLAMNITISLVILFVTLYMERPLMFSSFPAILLVTTLFRLGMNIASTRAILLNGDQGLAAAGSVIQAFGNFVVGGNYAVGAVVFALISIVNLKVITKGSGRIAEVAARFTLDAMPGKQMAIDSDLNTGLIGEAEAKKRRKEIQMESEFYGAMDGAAKFVAGDAAAGVLILGINIVGGFFIGIIQHGMDWKDAASLYTLLTIGDGLVSQIPSIIVSTASGIIVARAASGEELGSEVLGQLSQSNKPLFLSAVTCTLLALVPGLPMLPFLTLGAFCGTMGYLKRNATDSSTSSSAGGKKSEGADKDAEKEKKPTPGSTEEVMGLLGIDTLELELGFELVHLAEGDLVDRLRSLRRQFALDYGFVVPSIHIRDNVRIKPSEYRFMLRGAVIGGAELKSRHLLAMDPGTVTNPVTGTPTKEPAFGLDALWISDSDKERAQMSGYTVVDSATVITTHITELIRSNMHELVGRHETQQLIDKVQKETPKVVEELIPSQLSVGQIQQVLNHLLREQVSIRDMRTILETLADWAPTVKHPEKLAEQVRRRLSRTVTARYLTDEKALSIVSLNGSLERQLADAVQQTDEGSYLAVEPALGQALISRLSKSAEKFMELGATPIILAPTHLRPALFHFVERFVPGYAVVSHQEVTPNTKVQSLGVIGID